MHTITTIGLDIAKSVFQVHGCTPSGGEKRDTKISLSETRQRMATCSPVSAHRY
jgi:hypothetical protein